MPYIITTVQSGVLEDWEDRMAWDKVIVQAAIDYLPLKDGGALPASKIIRAFDHVESLEGVDVMVQVFANDNELRRAQPLGDQFAANLLHQMKEKGSADLSIEVMVSLGDFKWGSAKSSRS